MPTLTTQALQVVALVAAVLAVVGLALAAVALRRLAALRRAYAILQGDADHRPLVDVVGEQIAAVDGLRAQVDVVTAQVSAARDELSSTLRHVAVVRYDAFADMGGRMSFSAAFLDDRGDGVVLTSIHGRSDGRTYAKGVRAGTSDYALSPEEYEAIAVARGVVRPDRRAAAASEPEQERVVLGTPPRGRA